MKLSETMKENVNKVKQSGLFTQIAPNTFVPVEETGKYYNLVAISQLKKQLSDTDYKVIKCMEYQLVEKELPYDIAQLNIDRDTIRTQINELEREYYGED